MYMPSASKVVARLIISEAWEEEEAALAEAGVVGHHRFGQLIDVGPFPS